MDNNRLEPGTYVRTLQLLKVVPFSKPTLWRRVNAGDFPAPVKLSPGVTAWESDAVQAWLDARKSAPATKRDRHAA